MTDSNVSPATVRPWIGFVDQGLSSLTNFGATFVGLVSFNAAGFGEFSIAMAWYAIVIGATRAMVAEPQAIRHASRASADSDRVAADAAGSAFALGAIAAIGIAIGAGLIGGRATASLLALAVFLPLLAVQDSYRMSFIISGRYGRALANDGAWALFLVPALVTFVVLGSDEPKWLIGGWAGAGAIAGFIGAMQSRALPRLTALRGWLRQEGSLAYRFVAEFGLQRGSYELALILILAVSELEVVGTIAAARFLFAPLTVAFLSAQVVGIPEMVRLRDRDSELFVVTSILLISSLLALGLLAGLVIWAFQDVVAAIVGPDWQGLRELLVPMSIFVAAGGAILGATIVLRALAAARASVRASVLGGVTLVIVAPAFALSGDPSLAAWGLAVGATISASYWLWTTRYAIWLRGSQATSRRPGAEAG